ncbi:heme acquisition protein HasAp [Pseudomonas lopnurensis]|uniref:heme acquisition protein HasAp n=1 Tax=Pseudomonas lopnurensis TaxID=1477517 RepID=UPI001879FF91|nr:heme acquisition protein HasAp [Pseudomonas lopnurensis]MBE7374234.1 heme acquisition protein HasAp [Pseudomonas lopnurensis]
MATIATFCYSTNEDLYPAFTDWTDTLEDVLDAWASDGIPGTHPGNTGGFFTGGVGSGLSGDTYGFSTGSGYAFSVYGDLDYYFPPLSGGTIPGAQSHTLYGTIEKISFGGGLDTDGTVIDPFLTICFDEPITSDATNIGAYSVHDVVWGLMNGSLTGYGSTLLGTPAGGYGGLYAVLEDVYNVDLSDSIEDLGTAFEDCDCGAELVGVPEFDDYLLAA